MPTRNYDADLQARIDALAAAKAVLQASADGYGGGGGALASGWEPLFVLRNNDLTALGDFLFSKFDPASAFTYWLGRVCMVKAISGGTGGLIVGGSSTTTRCTMSDNSADVQIASLIMPSNIVSPDGVSATSGFTAITGGFSYKGAPTLRRTGGEGVSTRADFFIFGYPLR